MSDSDVVIIGAGVAGLSAATFSARLGMDTVVLERLMPGGQIINAEFIEDYPGINRGISGAELTGIMQEQACLLYTSPSPRDLSTSRMPSSA